MTSVGYYLPICHDFVAKTVYNSIIRKLNPSHLKSHLESPEYIHKKGINTATKVQHNKPYLILWDCNEKLCLVIGFSFPDDIT